MCTVLQASAVFALKIDGLLIDAEEDQCWQVILSKPQHLIDLINL